MKTSLFDFELPQDAVALRPASPRDSARLLMVRPDETPGLEDRVVRELPDLLRPGDALVFNDTRVIAAELAGVRRRASRFSHQGPSAASITFNLHKRVDARRWRAFARPAKRLKAGDHIDFDALPGCSINVQLAATIERSGDAAEGGEVQLAFSLEGAALDAAIAAIGRMPLPPYIASKRPADDADRVSYQTMYARREGAVAAPTAGLHFTPELFANLEQRGIACHFVTLHVGAGTFLPVKAEEIADHRMHEEWGEIPAATAQALTMARARGGRIVAVGTTSLRLLESAAEKDGRIAAFTGDTGIFITPGFTFGCVDLLLTNFHLPRSTLFMLVCAFCGLETMQNAYAHAIASRYRFYSYGDACLLHRSSTFRR